jgi:hypothetical protein
MVSTWFRAFHRGIAQEWKRHPPAARRSGLRAGGATALALAVLTPLVLVAPWGERDTLLYVFVLGGATMLLVLVATAASAVRESRRAKDRRRARASRR